MALIKCKECGKEVSTSAKNCPSCGAPVKKTLGYGGLILIAIIIFVAYQVNKPVGKTYEETARKQTAKPVASSKAVSTITISMTALMTKIKSLMPSEKLKKMEATFGKGFWEAKKFRGNIVVKAHYGKNMSGYWFVKNGDITCINEWARTWCPSLSWAPTDIQVDDVEGLFWR